MRPRLRARISAMRDYFFASPRSPGPFFTLVLAVRLLSDGAGRPYLRKGRALRGASLVTFIGILQRSPPAQLPLQLAC